MVVSELARAKINLCLHVTGRRSDGYHLLDSLVVFADVADRLTVAPADHLSLTVTGPAGAGLSAGDDNLVLRAARAMGPRGAAITLEKVLWALEDMKPEVSVPAHIRERARSAVDRMLAL